MAIQQPTKRRHPRAYLGALLLATCGASIGYAQDAVVNTPPELRDFRLDPPPPATTPEPETPEPSLQPPATQPSIEPTSAPPLPQPGPSAAERQRTNANPSTDSSPDVPATPAIEPSSPDAAPFDDVGPTDTQTETPTKVVASPKAEGMGILAIAALSGLLLFLSLGAFIMWRRRQRARSAPLPRPSQIAKPRTRAVPRRAPPRATAIVPTPALPQVRTVSMAFVPENAVVSFSSLTVNGQLQITNDSASATDALALSTVLISASNEQQRAIDHFFAQSDQVVPTPLPAIIPGEKIVLPLKLSVALNEMQTFSLQNKALIAPILLAKLVRLSPDGSTPEVARLLCMIGRESTPPKPRMGPLRLDQGPRSFGQLGQRALVS